MKLVRAELKALIRDFRSWAVEALRVHYQGGLLPMGGVEMIHAQTRKFLLEHLATLDGVDLTPTEKKRFMAEMGKLVERPIKPIEDALKALDKPWKYRDLKFTV